MADQGGRATHAAGAARPVEEVVREILAVVPAGCTWLLPVPDDGRAVADFRIAATSGDGHDIYGRGTDRVGARLTELYPSMVDGPLWRLYLDVLATGAPGRLADFRYVEKRSGVVADSLFDVHVHRVLGGLLVTWQRLDEDLRRLERTELLGSLGWAEYDLASGVSQWSPGMYRIFERDPALGPLSRAEQSAALLPDDHMLREAAWQTLDSGASSDVTVRFRAAGLVKYLRILSDVSRDADGTPLKIHAVVPGRDGQGGLADRHRAAQRPVAHPGDDGAGRAPAGRSVAEPDPAGAPRAVSAGRPGGDGQLPAGGERGAGGR
ncbi:hypothetical protein [Micromonospora sp. NPDC005206]|uniref:hypothetical protein n=1 Tax=Micromonospora sp. NPDC005206 TaxID=3157022 RepID=UPI0033ACE7CB